MEVVTVSPKYQVVIPLSVRQSLGIKPGQKVQVILYENRIELIPLHPGVSEAQAQENSGFDLLAADRLEVSAPPSAEELRLLREVIDPTGSVLGR